MRFFFGFQIKKMQLSKLQSTITVDNCMRQLHAAIAVDNYAVNTCAVNQLRSQHLRSQQLRSQHLHGTDCMQQITCRNFAIEIWKKLNQPFAHGLHGSLSTIRHRQLLHNVTHVGLDSLDAENQLVRYFLIT